MHRRLASQQSSTLLPSKVPTPSHRHAAPSAPWPFVDIDDEVDPKRIDDPDSHLPLSAAACDHKQTPGQEVCWCKYPQALYPNWTPRQQKKARLSNIFEKRMERCTIHYLDINTDGNFVDAGKREVNDRTLDSHWKAIQKGRPENVQVRALFVEGLSGDVLRILGTRYNLEPFFFSSAIGWIPSRHQTNVVPDESDHITITLTFIRPMTNPVANPPEEEANDETMTNSKPKSAMVIDTRAPLLLRSNGVLLLADQLAIHMVRSRTGNTIISLHPDQEHNSISAKTLHSRIHAAGRSVYWHNIFASTSDPTFVLLSLLWYALYAWDEALEHLYNHICFLESHVILTNDMQLTQELHVIRAHLLHFQSLLEDFTKTVEFVQKTANPSMEPREGDSSDAEEKRRQNKASMDRECGNMLVEIVRLEKSRDMQDKRVKNVMDLAFSMVNIEDSRGMQKLTEAAMKDSAAIKQISYLTMAFVPAGFVATAFGMNIGELSDEAKGTLGQYVAAAIPLTILTVWIIVAYQIQIPDPHAEERSSQGFVDEGDLLRNQRTVVFKRLDLWERLWWPFVLFSTIMERRKAALEKRKPHTRIFTD